MVRTWVTTGMYWQLAGWVSLIAGALLLASLFNAGVTNGTNAIEQGTASGLLPVDTISDTPYVQSGIHEGSNRNVSAATAALADGDDIHARFLASLRAQGLGAWTEP